MGWDFLTVLASADADLEGRIGSLSIRSVGIASLIIIVLLIYASQLKKPKNNVKKAIFGSIVAVVLATTSLLYGTTIYLNSVSDSGGPVHWHTDIEFWVCGTEVELRDPKGALSNKVGTATYHEHDDKRIHLEGVVVDTDYDASLEKFMKVTGGDMTASSITIPTEERVYEDDADGDIASQDISQFEKYVRTLDSGTVVELENGNTCGTERAEVQAFLMTYDKELDTYTQSKLADPSRYVMRDEANVPPGDCLIVEFAPTKDRSEYLCEQYGVRDVERCASFSGGVVNPKLCKVRENIVPANGGTPE
jgi:hypothetical protein